jgi:hypothetical protein
MKSQPAKASIEVTYNTLVRNGADPDKEVPFSRLFPDSGRVMDAAGHSRRNARQANPNADYHSGGVTLRQAYDYFIREHDALATGAGGFRTVEPINGSGTQLGYGADALAQIDEAAAFLLTEIAASQSRRAALDAVRAAAAGIKEKAQDLLTILTLGKPH